MVVGVRLLPPMIWAPQPRIGISRALPARGAPWKVGLGWWNGKEWRNVRVGEGIGLERRGFSALAGTPRAGPVRPMGFELPVPGLVEVVVGDGLRLSGIERRGLVEVARGVARFCGFGFGATEIELYLGWPA